MGHAVARRSGLAAATALAVLALGGCGGSSGARAGAHADPLLKMAQCMRAHGVPNFPDPSPGGGLVIPIRAHGVPNFPDPTTAPPASLPAQGLALGRGGTFLVVADPEAPALKHAAASCHFPLPHPPSG